MDGCHIILNLVEKVYGSQIDDIIDTWSEDQSENTPISNEEAPQLPHQVLNTTPASCSEASLSSVADGDLTPKENPAGLSSTPSPSLSENENWLQGSRRAAPVLQSLSLSHSNSSLSLSLLRLPIYKFYTSVLEAFSQRWMSSLPLWKPIIQTSFVLLKHG